MKKEALLYLGQLSMVIIFLLGMSSCAVSESQPSQDSNVLPKTQIIIKFTDELKHVEVLGKVSQIGAQYALGLRWLREMSGGAHVVVVLDSLTQSDLKTFLAKVQKRNDVIYVEVDGIMRHNIGQSNEFISK